MSLKKSTEEGFVLLESLVALTVLSVAILLILPTIVDLVLFVNQDKQRVEQYRKLYETAQVWEMKENNTQVRSGKWNFQVEESSSKILITGESVDEKALQIYSIELFSP